MKRIFSFCPGVAWPINRDKNIVIPKLTLDQWQLITDDRYWIVAGFGGLLESFCSLVLLEMLHQHNPSKKIFYSTPVNHQLLFSSQALGHCFPYSITPQLLQNNPLPIFYDQKKYAVFNYLNDYQYYHSLDFPYKEYRRGTPFLQQIASNFLLPWKNSYLPKFRNLFLEPVELTTWCRIFKFNYHLPFVVIFPDKKTSYSIHDKFNFICWDFNKLKSFVAILKVKKIQFLIVSEDINNKYKMLTDYVIFPKLDWLIILLSRAKLILSEKLDWLAITQMLSSAIICQKKLSYGNDCINPFSIPRQASFLKKENVNKFLYQSELNIVDIISVLSNDL